jgi:hypothetical protein
VQWRLWLLQVAVRRARRLLRLGSRIPGSRRRWRLGGRAREPATRVAATTCGLHAAAKVLLLERMARARRWAPARRLLLLLLLVVVVVVRIAARLGDAGRRRRAGPVRHCGLMCAPLLLCRCLRCLGRLHAIPVCELVVHRGAVRVRHVRRRVEAAERVVRPRHHACWPLQVRRGLLLHVRRPRERERRRGQRLVAGRACRWRRRALKVRRRVLL